MRLPWYLLLAISLKYSCHFHDILSFFMPIKPQKSIFCSIHEIYILANIYLYLLTFKHSVSKPFSSVLVVFSFSKSVEQNLAISRLQARRSSGLRRASVVCSTNRRIMIARQFPSKLGSSL